MFKPLIDVDLWQKYVRDRSPSTRNLIFQRNINLVHHVLHKFGSNHRDYEDCFQEGSMGMLRAIERFDPDLGVSFSSYACRFIWGSIAHYYRDKRYSIKFPRERSPEFIKSLDKIVDLDTKDTLMDLIAADSSAEDDYEYLRAEIARLPNILREPIEDVFLDGMTRAASAKKKGVAGMCVTRRINRGIAMLRETLDASEF